MDPASTLLKMRRKKRKPTKQESPSEITQRKLIHDTHFEESMKIQMYKVLISRITPTLAIRERSVARGWRCNGTHVGNFVASEHADSI